MRLIAAVPLVLSFVAFILSLLCLLAGAQPGFMEDYSIITLNTSRIGQNLFNTTASSSTDASNDTSLWDEISSDLSSAESDLQATLSDSLTSLAHALHLHDFYSMHVLDFCQGDFTPAAVANATLAASQIKRNVTACSGRSTATHFSPSAALTRELANSSLAQHVNLTTLHWPAEIDKVFDDVQTAASAMAVLYCVAVGLVVLAFLAAGADLLLAHAGTARWSLLLQLIVSATAVFTLLLASALVTGIADKVVHVANKYGDEVGVTASRGGKFVTLTWVAMGLMGMVTVVWGLVWWKAGRAIKRERRGKGGDA